MCLRLTFIFSLLPCIVLGLNGFTGLPRRAVTEFYFSTESQTSDFSTESGTTDSGTTDFSTESGTTDSGTTEFSTESGTTGFSTENGNTDFTTESGTTYETSSETFPVTTDPNYPIPTTDNQVIDSNLYANNSRHRNYETRQVSWNSVSPSPQNLPMLVQSQSSNDSHFIKGSVWQFQGSSNVSDFIKIGNLTAAAENYTTAYNLKPSCDYTFKEHKKIDSAWSKCEIETGLSNVTDISNPISPCFSKCLMDKLKLVSKTSSIKEKDVVKMFKLDDSNLKSKDHLAKMWKKCILQIDAATMDIYAGINSSCEHHATFMACGLQEITENCSMNINGRNLTFTADVGRTNNNNTTLIYKSMNPKIN